MILAAAMPSTALARQVNGVPPSVGPLPAGAVVSLSAAIGGVPGARAIAYQASASYLGVELSNRLLWHIKLPAPVKRLAAPGPKGLFSAWVPTSPGARFYAFSLRGTRVSSGVKSVPSGTVVAAEGGSFRPIAVVIKNPDTEHTGSVRYRLIDRFSLCSSSYCRTNEVWQPESPPSQYPVPNAVIKNKLGDTLLLKLEVADTEAAREQGLMFRSSLDPDSGMIFVWPYTVQESFWMENTYIPLTVAFLSPDGTILDMQDMAPQTTDLHSPPVPYQYAIEVNQGYFAAKGVAVGDKVALTLHS